MVGQLKKDKLFLQLPGGQVMLKVTERDEGYFTFEGGSLYLDIEGCIVGGILLNQRKYFFSGDNLTEFTIRGRQYPAHAVPVYSGFRTDDGARVRLYEPTLFSITKEEVENGWCLIKGIYYQITETKLLHLTPLSEWRIKARHD